MRHSIPEQDDDPADINPRGRRTRDIIDADYYEHDKPMAMPSWSWFGLAMIALCAIGALYLIGSGIAAVIRILF